MSLYANTARMPAERRCIVESTGFRLRARGFGSARAQQRRRQHAPSIFFIVANARAIHAWWDPVKQGPHSFIHVHAGYSTIFHVQKSALFDRDNAGKGK